METRMRRGQIFSLDFLIAMGLAVLAMGILLNYYETAASTEKEQRMQNELTAVAMNVSTQMLRQGGCNIDPQFLTNGYKVYGCSDPTALQGKTKKVIMLPRGFACKISWKKLPDIAEQMLPECSDDPQDANGSIASLEREFLTPKTPPLGKATYEKCISGNCQEYDMYLMTAKVWRR